MTLDRLREASWRVRLSQSRPGLAHLALIDHRTEVTDESLAAAVKMARALGATRVRTSALFDESAPTLCAAGFVDVDRLVVLQLDLDATSGGPSIDRAAVHTGGEHVRLHRLRRHSLGAAADVDAAAFGPQWATDRDGLYEAVAATPSAWGRYATIGWRRRQMAGFVLCGASGRDAYIQRLAVQPAVQRKHVASTLMAAALNWMSRHGTATVLVNTRPDNEAALALYQQWGFRPLRRGLIVAERTL